MLKNICFQLSFGHKRRFYCQLTDFYHDPVPLLVLNPGESYAFFGMGECLTPAICEHIPDLLHREAALAELLAPGGELLERQHLQPPILIKLGNAIQEARKAKGGAGIAGFPGR